MIIFGQKIVHKKYSAKVTFSWQNFANNYPAKCFMQILLQSCRKFCTHAIKRTIKLCAKIVQINKITHSKFKYIIFLYLTMTIVK